MEARTGNETGASDSAAIPDANPGGSGALPGAVVSHPLPESTTSDNQAGGSIGSADGEVIGNGSSGRGTGQRNPTNQELDNRSGPAGGGEAKGHDSQDAGSKVPGPRRKTVSKFDLALVLRETKGDRARTADILGMTTHSVTIRIHADDQLRAMYGDQTKGEPATVTVAESMSRSPDDMPDVETSVDLAAIISEQDNLMLRQGLEKLGVSQKTLTRLKDLDGLAKSSGMFLSVSLEKTHRMYFLQLVHLMEMADELRERLMIKAGEVGYIADDEIRAAYNKNYIEMVKEIGGGYKLTIEGAQAMVRMITAAKGTDPTGSKKKPAFSKLVSPPKNKAA